MEQLINKGTGAGGANTNHNGKAFEAKTDNKDRLLSNGYIEKKIPKCKGKNDWYLEHEGLGIIYIKQGGLKSYFKHFFNKELVRNPDEAYILKRNNTYILKILEKKNQNVDGSVEDKLMTGVTMRFEYQDCLGEICQVEYAYCLSNYLKSRYTSETIPKYKSLRKFNSIYNIHVLFGDDEDYFTQLDNWLSL